MLTAATLLDAARTRGIFAVPTRAGEAGPCLIGSLGLDVETKVHLLDLYDAGEIVLDRATSASIDSLVSRDLEMRLLAESQLLNRSGTTAYHTVLVPAVATTGADISDVDLREMQADAKHGHDARIALRYRYRSHYCREHRPSLDDADQAIARIAAAINHRRGILVP